MSDSSQTGRRARIAIAGATGRVGAALIRNLADDAVEVIALSRNPKGGSIPPTLRTATIDFDAPTTLSEALQGADRLFLAHGTSDRQVANEIALIDAAEAAGISHIVKLSSMGPPTRLHPFDWHMKVEAHLATKDFGYTILRPGPFANTLARAGEPVSQNNWGGAAGDGLVNLIDTRDIADVARIALLDERFSRSQRAYHLTGPGPVSMLEVAEELSRLLGRTVEYRQRTIDAHRAILLASGVSEMVAELLLGLDRLFAESVLNETTNTISDLTGRKARPVSAWLSDNLALFRGAPSQKP